MLGFVLLGSTLLIPLFAQTMLGYPAKQAGLALMPGGLLIICSMPLVGFLLSRRSDPRLMMAFGLTMVSVSLFYMTSFDLSIDFWTLATARMLQGCGLGFLFVPINTVAYSYLPPEKNNAASGIINLSRNVGASVGISIVTTMLDRRGQFHRDRLAAHLDPANVNVQAMLSNATARLQAQGASATGALQQSYAILQGTVQRQSEMLAYIDNFWMLALATLVLIPCVLLVRKPKRGGGMHAH
jgi:MFS transporter, DHA2 family, multidrug resistance protein